MSLQFDDQGYLPAGDHALTISALRSSILVTGLSVSDRGWDTSWRSHLVDQLSILCTHLDAVGITEIYADGSFASDKLHPGDIDGYFVCDYPTFIRDQHRHLIARNTAWDYSRRLPDAHGKMKILMWHSFQVELYPLFAPPFDSLIPAEANSAGGPVPFPEFFRRTRAGRPRGIIRITPGATP